MALSKHIKDEPNEGFTSMIDIVFLLLIFFILQPFKSPEMQLRAEMPKDGRSSNPPTGIVTPVHLQIRTNGQQVTYLVDGHSLGANDRRIMSAVLAAANHDREEVPVMLDPQQEVDFQYVMTAYDECLKAGMEKVRFAHSPSQ